MSEQENIQVAQEYIEAFNAHDVERCMTLIDEEALWESDTLPESFRGHEPIRQGLQMYITAFPDVRLDTEQIIASGDYVVGRVLVTGTHRGELQGMQPTNRRVEFHDCIVWEVKNGKLVYAQDYWDTSTMLRQLGVLPTPGQ